MQFDRGHRWWFYCFALATFGAGLVYAFDARRGHAGVFGASGGDAVGLAFGAGAFALILFAGTRGLRRWMPRSIGGSVFWSRAHVWLGLLVLPLAWFHGGFHHGGPLSGALMWILYAIVLSGAISAILRYYLSHPAGGRLSDELIDAPLEESMARLEAQAADIIARCEAIARRSEAAARQSGAEGGTATLTTVVVTPTTRWRAMNDLYVRSIQPYLTPAGQAGILSNRMRAAQMFRRCRSSISGEFHAPLMELEHFCDTSRSLRARQRLGLWVDRLMLVHVPLSAALIVLGAAHAVGSLRY